MPLIEPTDAQVALALLTYELTLNDAPAAFPARLAAMRKALIAALNA